MKKSIVEPFIECHIYLDECLRYENIDNKELICKNLNCLKDYKSKIPAEMYSKMEEFIKETINPIVYDLNYFSFLIREEYGHYDERKHFIVESDSSLESYIFTKYHHTLELRQKLSIFVKDILHINYED
jgi:hypothetical protein